MPIVKVSELPAAWTQWSVLSRDATYGDSDGILHKSEVSQRLAELETQRAKHVNEGSPTLYVDMKIDTNRKLYNDLVDAGADGVQYLPAELMILPANLRRRAVEILERDDVGTTGTLDQFALDHARGRYNAMSPATAEMLSVKTKALDEIDDLASQLGLQ